MLTIDADELARVYEASASDPDAPISHADMGILMRGALAGTATGFTERGPDFMSVDADFIRKAMS